MKDFKFEFTEEQKETIRKKLCHDDIHDIIDYLEVVCADAIQARADADDWVNIDPTKADQIPDINCWILTIGGDIEFCPEGCFVPFNYASHYKTIPIPSPPKTESK